VTPARATLALLIGANDGLWILLPGEEPRRMLDCAPVVAIDVREEVAVLAAEGQGVWTRHDGEWRLTYAGDARRVRVTPEGTLLAGVSPAAVYASADGETWEEWGNLQNLLRYHAQRLQATTIARDVGGFAFSAGTIVAVTGIGTFQTLDGGRSWSLHADGLDRHVHGLWEHPERPDRLYATSRSGFYRSEDGGYTWVQSLRGLDRSWAWDVAVLPGAPDTLLLSAARRTGGEDGALFRSVDGGISWSRRMLDDEDEWPQAPLVCSLTSPIDALFVLAGGRVWGSHDGGEQWLPIAEGLPPARSLVAAVGDW
jgi:photosystem II stability/assembly factor-like uncharacterized protein